MTDNRDPLDRRPRLLIAAAVVAVIVVLLGVSLVTGQNTNDVQPVTDQTPVPTTPAAPEIVPWLPLDPTHPDLPVATIPASPDPGAAAAARSCTAEDLRAVSRVEGAAGTAVLNLTIRPVSSDVSCRIQGHPSVQFLDHGQPVEIPTVNASDDSTYRDPALVAAGNAVTLSLYWGSNWCTDPVLNDRIRVAVGSGWLELDGFGRSPHCNGKPGSGPNPISVGSFQPHDYRPAEVTSAYSGVDGELIAVSDPVPGEELRFLVTLTAQRGDVSLEPCPDYSMAEYAGLDDSVAARFALNCAALPYRDAKGAPYLPDGVPVQFEMTWTLLGPNVEETKAIWRLEAADGPVLEIPTRSDGN